MAHFTSTSALNLQWYGWTFTGAAGTHFWLPDSAVASFIDDPGPIIPGLAWFDIVDPTDGGTIVDGTIGIDQMDTTPPGVATDLTLTSSIVQTTAGPVTILTATLTQPADTDLLGTWVEITTATGDYTQAQRGFIASGDSGVSFTSVMPNTPYYARAQSVDFIGNWGSYTAEAGPVTTDMDAVAPDVPLYLIALPGFRGAACAWAPSTAADLARYELQYTYEDIASPGNPNTGAWVSIEVAGTVKFIQPLDPALLWFVQIRAVDTSGNASAWSTSVSVQPTFVGYADVTAASAVIELLRTGTLTADAITSGKLVIKSTGTIGAIEIRDSDAPAIALATWDTNGIYLRDPAARTTRWMRLTSGGLYLVTDGVDANAVAAITPDGISANAVNFGTAHGGHNVVLNPSFELAAWLAQTTALITTDADFTAAETAYDNRTIGSNSVSVAAW